MKKIVAFGDSFFAGNELKDPGLVWPGVVAQRLGVEFETPSIPGCGNDRIAAQIYEWFANKPVQNVLAVVNWTWTARWDLFLLPGVGRSEFGFPRWITLGPSCVPSLLDQLVETEQAQQLIDFYKTSGGHSLFWNVFRNLQTITAVQHFLWSRGIVAVQTYMDYHLVKDSDNNFPAYIHNLQQKLQQQLYNFEGMNFVDWSKSQGFTVTEPGMHPLEQAHEAAADYWQSKYSQLLGI